MAVFVQSRKFGNEALVIAVCAGRAAQLVRRPQARAQVGSRFLVSRRGGLRPTAFGRCVWTAGRYRGASTLP